MTPTTFFLAVIFLAGLFIGSGLIAMMASLMYYKAQHGGLDFKLINKVADNALSTTPEGDK